MPWAQKSHFGTAAPLPDVSIYGAGIIGLSLALELHARGALVEVLEKGQAMRQASSAAAGMLAVDDPDNPPQLLGLARRSREIYPAFLDRISHLSGQRVRHQTETTIQRLADGTSVRLAEWSLDPRQLADALLAVVRTTNIRLRERATADEPPYGKTVVIASGAWSGRLLNTTLPVVPRKGQMLRVRLPKSLPLDEVRRNEHIYVVPRLWGPQAGTAILGATVEDCGFDVSTHTSDLARLRRWAGDLVPEIASEDDAPLVDAWAGLRPATPDGLPLMGRLEDRFVATGHYRNGILLAPGTAEAMANCIEGKPTLDLSAFDPLRFSR